MEKGRTLAKKKLVNCVHSGEPCSCLRSGDRKLGSLRHVGGKRVAIWNLESGKTQLKVTCFEGSCKEGFSKHG